MIGFLRGNLVEKSPPHLVLDVGGVGYEVEAPMSTFYKLPETGTTVMLYTHLAIRDDAHILFGFADTGERAMFRSLIKVNGVGAKMALAILSGINAEGFARCVEQEDSAALVRLPGIGRKTAERLIVEMRDRLPSFLSPTVSVPGGMPPGSALAAPNREAVSALESLGYKPAEALRLVRDVASDGLSSEEIIRAALKSAVRS
ncbi:MAG: Holliday junction branch migration protein RuvA [Chromatiales bacterium]|nr:Holliday junction branch migration protein RuvA [Chromatiales bacterium]